MNKVETYNRNNILSQIKWLIKMVRYLLGKEISEGNSGIQSIQDGNGTDIDNTDPNNPIINILEVSATESGIVNNTPLQELGGVDKLINGVRIGRGSGNNQDNVIGGEEVLNENTTGFGNTAFGKWVLTVNTTGRYNSSFGNGALYSNTTGIYNSAFGASTLQNNTTGSNNSGLGTSLFWNSTGQRNTGVGFNAGYGATTGSFNTYIGNGAGYNNGIGSYNVAIGSHAMSVSFGSGTTASTLNMNNNVMIGSRIQVADGVNNVLAIDNKGGTTTNYANALLYGNFADRFLRINGRFEVAPSTMPVGDAGFTKKLVWNPTTGVVAGTDDTGIQSIQEGDNISIDNTDPQNPVISALGGGATFITTTKSNLDTLIVNEELIPNALYEITGVEPLLYGGTTIYLQAVSTTELNPNGVGKFYNPKYDQTQQGFGIAVDYVHWADVGDQKPSGVYAVNDVVIWGGKHWTCIQPTTTSTKYIVDTFNLDTDYFVEIPFNETDYNVAYDAIKYDYENDWIVERNEKNSNIVSFDYEWLKNFECMFGNCNGDPNDLIQVDPIKNFQWGNVFSYYDYVGIGFQRITNSLNQNINFRGSYQIYLTFNNGSYQIYLTFNNGSYQENLTFDNGSSQENLTFDNYSYQEILTFDNGGQRRIIFDNYSYQSYLTFNNSSSQRDITFDNGNYQESLTFDNNSSQSKLISSSSNKNQRWLTFNNFFSNRTGQPLSSDENNLTFDNTIQNLPKYGQGYVTGTPTYILGVTADGKVVEMDLLQSITGYDAGETQTLKNVNGVLTWVTD